MEPTGNNNTDTYRGSSGISSSSRRYGMQLSASNIIQAPVSALLEYLRTRTSNQESEGLIDGPGFRDLQSRLEDSSSAAATAGGGSNGGGEVSIRIIGEQENDSLGGGQVREGNGGQNEVAVQQMAGTASGTGALYVGDSRNDRGGGEGVSQSSSGGSADGEAVDGGGANNRDSSYQRYDI